MLARQLWRLGKHSAIYGLGAVVSRLLGLFLLPVVTHYLSRRDLGAVDTLIALSVVLVIVLRAGISMAFFRFYFDADDDAARVTVVRTSFWFTMTVATAGLVAGILLAGPISEALFGNHSRASLVRDRKSTRLNSSHVETSYAVSCLKKKGVGEMGCLRGQMQALKLEEGHEGVLRNFDVA